MDTWLIAQCMARLPRQTYFSHPEPSLHDFFSGEANAVIDRKCRRDYSPLVQQGIAPHEHRFISSLTESLGIHPSMGPAVQFPFRHHHGRHLSRSVDSDSIHLSPRITAEDAANQPSRLRWIHDYQFYTDSSGTPSSSSSPIMESISPNPSNPPNVPWQAPAMSSSSWRVFSCEDLAGPKPVRVQDTKHAHRTSSQYQCNWEIPGNRFCGEWIEGGSTEVWMHVRVMHGLKGLYKYWCNCRWGGCSERLRVSNLKRHLAKHLEIKWRCSGCGVVFARYDYVRRHIKLSEGCRGAEASMHLVSEKTPGISRWRATAIIAKDTSRDRLLPFDNTNNSIRSGGC